MEQYDLWDKVQNIFIYCKTLQGMYGLPQAGIISNQLLQKRLAKHGYFKLPHTPGLWKHEHKPTAFTLVVNDFGIKYVSRENLSHLMNALKEHYELSIINKGPLYCGITLKYNYDNNTST